MEIGGCHVTIDNIDSVSYSCSFGSAKKDVPFSNSHMSAKKRGRNTVEVQSFHSGSKDLVVLWSTSGEVVISMPSTMQSKVCGLCGNFDDLR